MRILFAKAWFIGQNCPIAILLFWSTLQKSYPGDASGKVRVIPYKTISARGCPYTCTYCSIGSQNKKKFPFRARSVENLIHELQQVVASYGDIFDIINFSDDTFLVHPKKWITTFCDLYTEKIKYPFRVLAHPLSMSADKIDMLSNAGCMHFAMGIESLSEKTLYECFNRKTPVHKVIDAANFLVETSKKYDYQTPPKFDMILGNPYEDATERLRSFRLLTQIRHPARFALYFLSFFPGTQLFHRATEDGIIKTDDPELYRSWFFYRPNEDEIEMEPLLKILYRFVNHSNIPRWYLRLLSSPVIFQSVNSMVARYSGVSKFFSKSPKFFDNGKISWRYFVMKTRKRLRKTLFQRSL